MTTITILAEKVGAEGTTYRALAGEKESVGRTAGEALDALTSQLSDEEAGMLVIVQRLRPDRLFTAEQQQRLSELMSRWRAARDAGRSIADDEQSELESLVEAELEAARRRAEAAVQKSEHESPLP
jgi:hypothetical protein